MTNKQEVTILLVEDDPGHARLIEKNLRRSNITNEIITVLPTVSKPLTICLARARIWAPSILANCWCCSI